MTYRVRRGFLCDLERRTQRGKEGWKPECTEHLEKLIFNLAVHLDQGQFQNHPDD